jgi:RND family efflux transporter MFP subunit
LFKLAFSVLVISASFVNAVSAAELSTFTIQQTSHARTVTVEGSVEAIKSSLIAPQVAGSITALPVKVGDEVRAGQTLVKIDTRIANEQAVTNRAQAAAAQAQLVAARQEFERKRRLYEKEYISQAALERAESDYKTAEAQTKAQLAQTGVANVQAGLHTIHAPYTSLVAEVMAEQGDMAMPGKPLLKIYDPKTMRVEVNVPQTQLASIQTGASVEVTIVAAIESERHLVGTQATILPMADAVSNMVKVRVTLPAGLTSVRPGMFARAVFAVNDKSAHSKIYVPASAIVKRSELTAVYVVNAKGVPQLRQVRLGRKQGDEVEIFAGLQAGEKIATDAIAAANFQYPAR